MLHCMSSSKFNKLVLFQRRARLLLSTNKYRHVKFYDFLKRKVLGVN